MFESVTTTAALALLKAPDAHLSANTSGYDTLMEDPLSIQASGGGVVLPPLGPIRIRNLEDILKRLQHHLQNHQEAVGGGGSDHHEIQQQPQQQPQQQIHHHQQQEP